MISRTILTSALAGWLMLAAPASVRADELRNLKPGQPAPEMNLTAIDGTNIEAAALKGSVVVMVYLSAEQRSSELAAAESQEVVRELNDPNVKLVHVTADVASRDYFIKFRREHKLEAPLGADADRSLYHKLGLIVFPTTLVLDREGKLAHVISLRGLDYSRTLDAYIRHAAGTITAEQMSERLKATTVSESSPRSLASAHRAAARLHRDKGRPDAARQELVKARELDPTDQEAQLDLADLDLSSGRYDEADKTIDEILKAQPTHRRAKQLKGISLFRRDKLAEAETALTECLGLNPDPTRAHYYLGRIYEKQGNAAKALEHYRAALQRAMHEPD